MRKSVPAVMLPFSFLWCVLVSHASLAATVDGFLASGARRPLPDARFMTAPAQVAASSGWVSSFEPRLGVPTFFWSAPAQPGARTFRAMGLTAEQAARRYLVAHAELYRASPGRWAEARTNRVHDLGDQGAVIVSFQQRVQGVRVFRDEVKVIMGSDLQLVAIAGYLTPEVRVQGEFLLTDASAVASAYLARSGRGLERTALTRRAPDGAGFSRFDLAGEATPVRVRPVYFPLATGVVPAYHVELDLQRNESDSDYASVVISAVDGGVLFEASLTAADSFSYRVWADDSPAHFPVDGPQGASATPHPTGLPNGYSPGFVSSTLVSLSSGPISTGDAWLPAGATETSGNNVKAYADLARPAGFGTGDLMGAVSAPGAFDWAFDPRVEPNANTTQRQAAITQLFYSNNFFHDWYYDVGFDEQAGNAQASNRGRGGVDGDVLLAEAQDYSGRNNANMSTPSDGASPRMQMYVFDGESTQTLTVSGSPSMTFAAGSASFGPQTYRLEGELVVAENGALTNGCTAITNNVAGKIALIDRGTCTFVVKVQAAQTAGAIAAIIMDNAANTSPPPLQGSGTTSISTPSLSVTQSSGQRLKALPPGTRATLTRSKGIDADGTIDTAIVAHEWGHYISNRLIGDGTGISNNQAIGMGEGWADFHSMLLLVRAEDTLSPTNTTWNGVYGMAAYTSFTRDPQGYYWGIRRLPYSTDLTKNGLTFKHIQDGVPLPRGVPTAFGLSGASNSEVHNTGEVWGSMLWECYAGLLRDSRYTFVQAQDRMRGYLVAAYKATALMPTFVDARDALLAVAVARDQQDYVTFWNAFAKRGMGMGAVAPDRDSQDNTPVTESFVLGNAASITAVTVDDSGSSCDQDGVLDANETGMLTVTLKNVGISALAQASVQVTTSTAGVTLGAGGQVALPATQPFASSTVKVPVSVGDVRGIQASTFLITVTDPSLVGGPVSFEARFRLNFDVRPNGSTTDDVEAPTSLWTSANDPDGNTGSDFRIFQASATEHFWFGPNPSSPADTWLISPTLQVGAGPFSLTFKHRFDFEKDATSNYDGAVIELSTDNGVTWTDVGAKSQPGYVGTLVAGAGTSASSNPLAGRQAWVGKSLNYPAFLAETVSFGTAYANQAVKVRFRIGADDAAAAKGWEIDDLAFTGITNTPFTTVVADPNQCSNRAPVATVSDQEALEGAAVTLVATLSDPDGDPLSPIWTQTSGPMVQLNGGTFTAPAVDVDTTLGFSLAVSDGRVVSGPFAVQVLVKDVNQPPSASAPAVVEVDEGGTLAIVGRGNDPEGQPVTFEWRQTSGPFASLDNTTADTVTLVAPIVVADAVVVLELVVRDQLGLASAPARVELMVRERGLTGDKPGCGCSGAGGFALLGLAALVLRRRRSRT